MKKIVLAYSGGLDTSVILKWLQNTYNCPVVTFTADIGQGEELKLVEKKAQSLGVEEIYIENLQGPVAHVWRPCDSTAVDCAVDTQR